MLRLARVAAALVTAASLLSGVLTMAPTAAQAAAAPDQSLEQQLVDAVNGDRTKLGVPTLIVDPRLTLIARTRDQFQIDHGFFSHCINGAASCTTDQLQFGILLQQAGFPQMNAAENLAVNTQSGQTAADAINAAWMASPHHEPNIANAAYNVTGMGVVCCGTFTNNGQTFTGVRWIAQIFAQYTPAMLTALQTNASAPASAVAPTPEPTGTPAPASAVAPAPAAAQTSGCELVLGFKALQSLDPTDVGNCTDNEAHNPVNGDALQHTTNGLLVWRKADNWTAFTNGFWTWINGPNGLVKRLNTQRFPFEANPDGLPVVTQSA